MEAKLSIKDVKLTPYAVLKVIFIALVQNCYSTPASGSLFVLRPYVSYGLGSFETKYSTTSFSSTIRGRSQNFLYGANGGLNLSSIFLGVDYSMGTKEMAHTNNEKNTFDDDWNKLSGESSSFGPIVGIDRNSWGVFIAYYNQHRIKFTSGFRMNDPAFVLYGSAIKVVSFFKLVWCPFPFEFTFIHHQLTERSELGLNKTLPANFYGRNHGKFELQEYYLGISFPLRFL